VELILKFNTVLYVPNLSTIDHMLNVLDEVNLFSKYKMASLRAKLQGKQQYDITENFNFIKIIYMISRDSN